MKTSCVVVVYVVVCASFVSAQSIVRVRPVDPLSFESLQRGRLCSPLIRELVQDLESSDLIVHIETTFLPPGLAGTTRFAARRGSHRYVRIALRNDLSADSRAAILGHELQHAREIAQSDASDEAGVHALFAAIGHRLAGSTNTFETSAAAQAGLRVWRELQLHSSAAALTANQQER